MKVRVFYPNSKGKIEFTKKELEKLLDEVYQEGHCKGYREGYESRVPTVITYPYTPYWYHAPYYTTSTSGTLTLNGTCHDTTLGDYTTYSSIDNTICTASNTKSAVDPVMQSIKETLSDSDYEKLKKKLDAMNPIKIGDEE